MRYDIHAVGLVLAATLASSCLPKGLVKTNPSQGGSSLSSITMPIPPSIKSSVSPDKINAYSLSIKGGACETSGTTGTTVSKPFAALTADETLANEKLRRSCEYTMVLSLGKADSSGTKLEKIYLTNDIDGQRTQVTKEAASTDKMRVVVTLSVTDDGRKDLGLGGAPVPIPSSGEVDAIIEAEISKDSSKPVPDASDYNWRQDVQWATVPETSFTGDYHGSEFYKDVMSHVPAALRDFGNGFSTDAHETHHMLVNEMRNKTSADDAFVYFEKGQGFYVIRPKKVLSQVKNYVGENFKKAAKIRYDTYLVKNTSWVDPLYMFDEWNAYVVTTRTAVEITAAKKWDNQNADPVDGLIDFLYIGCAVVVALKDLDPEYLASNKQFKAAFALLGEQSMEWSAKAFPQWKSSAGIKRLEMLRQDPESEKLRSTVREFMGAAWTKRVLGF